MEAKMKDAYKSYFAKLDALYQRAFGTRPTVPYSESFDRSMLIGAPDEDGEIQWVPKVQEHDFDWAPVEAELGFALCPELRDYYNSFFFLALSGSFGSSELHFYRIDGTEPLEKIILRHHQDAQHLFPGTECFLIGNAVVNDDDSYFIYFDNASGKLFCYESDTKKELLLSYSIAKTIGSMEAAL